MGHHDHGDHPARSPAGSSPRPGSRESPPAAWPRPSRCTRCTSWSTRSAVRGPQERRATRHRKPGIWEDPECSANWGYSGIRVPPPTVSAKRRSRSRLGCHRDSARRRACAAGGKASEDQRRGRDPQMGSHLRNDRRTRDVAWAHAFRYARRFAFRSGFTADRRTRMRRSQPGRAAERPTPDRKRRLVKADCVPRIRHRQTDRSPDELHHRHRRCGGR